MIPVSDNLEIIKILNIFGIKNVPIKNILNKIFLIPISSDFI